MSDTAQSLLGKCYQIAAQTPPPNEIKCDCGAEGVRGDDGLYYFDHTGRCKTPNIRSYIGYSTVTIETED